ncbi:MAG: APC family permease [Armatimonadota bacterium]|nr:APC family permease [Armatimonadota bacterium]
MRQFLIGAPLPTAEMPRQTVGKFVGLAVFASDVLSSVAYATEEMLVVLALAGAAYFGLSVPIAVAISLLLAVLTISYRQTIFAYPNGGGAYIVARDNLGELAAQVAGAALLTDYILTVSVSIASGVAQIISVFPSLAPWRVEMAVVAILCMMTVNLRGTRESGAIFAVPTYLFLTAMLGMLAVGFYQLATGHLRQVTGVHLTPGEPQPLTLFLLLRAFSSGAVAVTGTEAVSNGITAFREPRSRNAAATMAWMSSLVGVMFVGTTVLANRVHALPVGGETVISQIARTVYGPGALHVTTLAAATLILILAANTAYADFPRLAALHARDGFLPRQLTYRGARLVFSWGIVALSAISSFLVVAFGASVSALIPLYAIGVFLSFTLSQAGMVVHWRKAGARGKQAVNAVGALLTLVVVVILAVTKFAQGAWIVVILTPALVWMFFRVHHHYEAVRARLSVRALREPPPAVPVVHLLLIADVHAAALRQVQFARSMGLRWVALHVEIDPEKTAEVRAKWRRFFPRDPLVVLSSPLRDLIGPIRRHVERLRAEHPTAFIHVITSQLLMDSLLAQVLHQNTALILKLALQHIPMVVVSDVAYPLGPPTAERIPEPPGDARQSSVPGPALPAGTQRDAGALGACPRNRSRTGVQ